MDFTKLKTGDILEIKGKKYEVIGILKDAECLPPRYKFRDMLTFDLLEKGSKRITPTHWIGYYFDTKEAFFSNDDPVNKLSFKLRKKDISIISS